MPNFAIYCRDKPNTEQTRKDVAPAHLKHVEKFLERYLVAGPLRDDVGTTVGSLLVIKGDSATDARLFLEQDPYFEAGIWDSIAIDDFLAAAGEWIGGKTW